MEAGFPAPQDLGLPPKFSSWRDNQVEAITEYLECDRRFLAQCAATGCGKSLIYAADACLTSGYTVILTSTKALQQQLLGDFSEIGMVEIKGKNAYRCRQDKYGRGCDYGDCNFGLRCSYQSKGCDYYDALRVARNSKLIVTNYSYWLSMNYYNEGVLPNIAADLLVLDEAHHADRHLCDVLTVHVRPKETEELLDGLQVPENMRSFGAWVKEAETRSGKNLESMLTEYADGTGVSTEEIRGMKALDGKIAALSEHWNDTEYLVELQNGIKMCPIWPRKEAENKLYAGSKKVLFTSATVRPKTVEMLGLTPEMGQGDEFLRAEVLRSHVEEGVEGEMCRFSDYPSIFRAENRLLIHLPFAPNLRINRHTNEAEYKRWIYRIDQIIAPRLHQKGIVHTISYERRNRVVNQSEHARHMITHDSRGVLDAVKRFKKADPPSILVSPSVMMGFDFPHDLCRWQIIGKIGFPDTRDRLLKARLKTDPDYGAYLAMQSLVQAAGRGTRSPSDSCVSFLIDDSAFWFMKKYRHFAPKWFLDGYRVSSLIPQVEG